MELKGRLKLIAECAGRCNTVCDIGTDHAYVPIYMAIRGMCGKAVVTDNRKGPIEIAVMNIKKYGLEERIEARLGYGLNPIMREELDTVVIAGMGGMLIKEILERDIEKAEAAKKLVLQPMNAVEVVRGWLYGGGYDIFDEQLADEGKKIYNVISARWTGKIKEAGIAERFLGEKLLERQDDVFMRFVGRKLKQVDNIIRGLKKSGSVHEVGILEYETLKGKMMEIMEIIDRKNL